MSALPITTRLPACRLSTGRSESGDQQAAAVPTQETIALEQPVAITVNGITQTILMASPAQLEWLAMGFLYSEGIIRQSRDCVDIELIAPDEGQPGWQVQIQVTHAVAQRLSQRRRLTLGATGCGLCGIAALSEAWPELDSYVRPPGHVPTLEQLMRQLQHLNDWQRQHDYSGALHAASMAISHDQPADYRVFEDVGRHNALDKLLGYRLIQRMPAGGGVLMTSRLSIELVQKAIRGQLDWLAGISAPTAAAIELAQRYQLTLIGFVRDQRMTIYHAANSLKQP